MIRTYRPSDLETLQEITLVCFDGISIDQSIENTFGTFGETDWRRRKARHIDEDAQANPEGIFVYEEDGKPVGYITTRIDAETRIGGIPNLAVLPEHQGKGIGKALMVAAFDYFEASGMVLARIETVAQNPVGTVFYPRSGFQEIARQVHYAMPLKDRKL